MLLLICTIVFYFKVKWIENKKLKKEPKRIICGFDTNSNALRNLFLQISGKFTSINFVKIDAAKIKDSWGIVVALSGHQSQNDLSLKCTLEQKCTSKFTKHM